MANLTETATWDNVYQIEQTDPVIGGVPNPGTGAGMSNIPHLQLLNRTAWLRAEALKAWDTDNSQASLQPIGWQDLGSGLILQWREGSLSASDTTGSLIAFPKPFPTACFGVVCCDLTTAADANPGTAHTVTIRSTTINTTGFRAYATRDAVSLSSTTAFFVALGH